VGVIVGVGIGVGVLVDVGVAVGVTGVGDGVTGVGEGVTGVGDGVIGVGLGVIGVGEGVIGVLVGVAVGQLDSQKQYGGSQGGICARVTSGEGRCVTTETLRMAMTSRTATARPRHSVSTTPDRRLI
jgi:hypothetical protein